MKNHKLLLSLMTIIIMGLVITSGASIPITKITSHDDEIHREYACFKGKPVSISTIKPSMKTFAFDSHKVTGGNFNEYHPSVAGAPGGGFYALTEYSDDGELYYPILLGSYDGVTWDLLLEFLDENSEYTDLDQNEHGTYGTYGAPPLLSNHANVVTCEKNEGFFWDFGEDFDNISNNRIACYTFEGPDGDPGLWNFGSLTFTGDNHYFGTDISGSPFICYPNTKTGCIIDWLLNYEGCEHSASAFDTIKNYHYAIYDYYDGITNNLAVRVDDFGKWIWSEPDKVWIHDFKKAFKIISEDDLTYPSVAAHDDNIIIACQKEDDVIVYWSVDGLVSKEEVFIENSAFYPEVEFTGAGYIAVITYIKNDKLWFKTSSDKGETWSSPEEVINSEPNLNDRAVQLDQYNGHVYGVWEDKRGENNDIYFDLIFELINDPPSAPNINGPPQGNSGQLLTFTFKSDDPDNDKIKYIINWGDGKSDTTSLYPSGTDVMVKHTWDSAGGYIITAKAQDIKGGNSPEATFNVKIPRKRIFSSRFFDIFPSLYRVFHLFLR